MSDRVKQIYLCSGIERGEGQWIVLTNIGKTGKICFPYFNQRKYLREKQSEVLIQRNKARIIHPEKRREGNRKAKAKRKRILGYKILNTAFKDSEGHHIDKEHIVYIPEYLHKSVPHNIFTGEGMESINEKALRWIGYSMLAGSGGFNAT